MIAAALVAAQYVGTLDFSDRTDVRYRVTEQSSVIQGTQTPLASAIDLATQITARAHVTDRRWEVALAYTPILTAPDAIQITPEAGGVPPQPLVIQSANALIGWHSRRLRLTSTGGVTYGQFNSALLYQPQAEAGQPVVLQPVPRPQSIQYFAWFADASAAFVLDQRSNLVLRGGYQASGQVDALGTPDLPTEYGPHASASFDFMLDRADHLVTSAVVSQTSFSSAPCAPVAGMTAPPIGITCAPESDVGWLQEEVRRQVSPSTRVVVGIGLGASETRHVSPGAPTNTEAFPVAAASLSQTFGPSGQGVLQATVQLLPVTDILTGDVSDQLQGTLSLTERLSSIVSLRTTATDVQSILPADYPFPLTIGTGEVQATFKLNRWVDVLVGDQALWESEKNLGSVVSVFCYVGMIVRAETLHF